MTDGSKGLSLNEIRRRVAKFVLDYQDVTRERQHTGDFWRDFMRCYGVESSYLQGVTFEYPARRSDTGGQGYIDAFLPGHYLIEQKSEGLIKRPKGAERSNAEQQAEAYLTGGDITSAQMPRYVVTSDFATIQVSDLSAPRTSPVRTKTVRTADLADHVEMFLFLTGRDVDTMIADDQAEASVAAARLMGDLYAALTGDDDVDGTQVQDAEDEDEASQEASILLTRLLFLMFGDDAGLWGRGLFLRFIETRTAADGSDLGAQLTALFNVLDTPEARRDKRIDEALTEFPYVNGAVFRHDDTMMRWFDRVMRDALLAACRFDWSRISPAVFGSLFQTVKSKTARREAGEHYTSEANILKVLRPMFLDGLRARLDVANTKPALEALHAELRTYRYVDPACGCGNFLIVAYREMRALELDLLVKLQAKRGAEDQLFLDPSSLLHVTLDQFSGIELNWWPAKIAETAMFLVDHQANQRMAKTLGYTPNRLPINIEANIHHANALTADWDVLLPTDPGARVFMFGNPPFLGRQTTSEAQKAELAAAWAPTKVGHLDFVTSWHAKALGYLDPLDGEFAFVTTNSITQGEPVSELFGRIESHGWRIKFAHRTFAWNSESASKDKAAVHCVVVGFTRDRTVKPRLFTYASAKSTPAEIPVTSGTINGYLVDGPQVYATGRSTPLADLPEVSFGSMPRDGGALVVTAEEYETFRADPIAFQYVRPYIGNEELVRSKPRWCLWLVDLDPADVPRSRLLKDRLERCARFRTDSKASSTRAWADRPHLFVQQAQPDVPYLAIPGVFAESRRYPTVGRMEADVIASNALFTCPDPDGFAFSVISSSMFMTWQRTVGGRLKSDPRFSKEVVWNTLPLPQVSAKQRRQIIEGGERVLAARALHPDRSLADHYQPLAMDRALIDAHAALDRVVDRTFGARRRAPGEAVRQQVLFARYGELVPPGV